MPKILAFLQEQNLWKKKDIDSYFEVAMGSYDRTEICKFIYIYLVSKLCPIISKNDCGHYDAAIYKWTEKKIIKISKEIGF